MDKEKNQKKYADKMRRAGEKIRRKRSFISLYIPRLLIALVVFGLFGGMYFYSLHVQMVSGEAYRDWYRQNIFDSFRSKEEYKEGGEKYIDAEYFDETNQWITAIQSNDLLLPIELGEAGYWGVYDYTNDKVLAEYSENKFIIQLSFRRDKKSDVHAFVLADEQVDKILQLVNDNCGRILGRLDTGVYISSGYIKGSNFYIEKYRIGVDGEDKTFELGDMSGCEHFELDIFDKSDVDPANYDKYLYWDGLRNHYGTMGKYAISSRGCLMNASCFAVVPNEEDTPISGEIDAELKEQAKKYLDEFVESTYDWEKPEDASGVYQENSDIALLSIKSWRACILIDKGTVYGITYVQYYKNQFLVEDLYNIIIRVIILSIIVAGVITKLDYMKYKVQREMFEYRTMITNTMAHDLKSPLMAISGYTDNILENTNPNKNEYYLREIAKKTSYMNGLIENILELSKSEELVVNKKEQLDIANVLRDIKTTFEQQLEEKGLSVAVDGSKVLNCDKTAMTTVLRNLFENAVKYSDNNGEIAISLTDEKIVIKNPCDKLKTNPEKLFDAYVKDDTSRTGTKGNGLGLAIVKSICDAHGYKVSAAYNEGLFTINIIA